MRVEDLSLRDLVARAYSRAVPANRFKKLVTNWLEQRELSGSSAEDAVADTLLVHTVSPFPPALLLTYLSQAIDSGILTSRIFLIHLLFLLAETDVPSISFLASASNIILANPRGLDPADPLPSSLKKPSAPLAPIPNVGTSASAFSGHTIVETSSTLALLLPLLRLCSLSAPSPVPSPIVALTTRILSLLDPYPAPSWDVGLEAGNLLQSLPESLAAPLRACLRGLMADLAISQDAAQLQISSVPVVPLTGSNGLRTHPTSLLSSISSLPLSQMLSFLLSHSHRSTRWTPTEEYASDPPIPPSNHIQLIRLGPYIASDPSTFLLHLIQTVMDDWGGKYNGGSPEGLPSWIFLTEALPVLLAWWKDNPETEWPFPETLSTALEACFASQIIRMAADNSWLSTAYDLFVAHADDEDDTGPFTQPQGWMLCSVEAVIVHRLVELGLLAPDEVRSFLPNLPVSVQGESLVDRLASAPRAHLAPLAHLITFAPGAARAFSTQVIDCIRAYPGAVPPEDLFANLACVPSLLACLTITLMPVELLDVLVAHLLEPNDDELGRADDPRSSLTRFGEGFVLIEAVVDHFQLPLPDLLQDTRRALNLADLQAHQRSNLNGWVKALFGSDGIDDQILLSTSSQDFCRLVSGLIQQAISATTVGHIDLETLHSGLSYFSQPLLSWSLGGVVTWLSSEIVRNGLLSAIQLDVLQTLLLASSFPEPLLQVTCRGVKAIFEPAAGLGPVFQTSGIDSTGLRQKAEYPIASSDTPSPEFTLRPLLVLRTELQAVRHLDVRQPTWTKTLLDAIESAASLEGPVPMVQLLIGDVLQASLVDLENLSGDTLIHFAIMLFSLRLTSATPTPLIACFIDEVLPLIFDNGPGTLMPVLQLQSTPYAISVLARLIKQSLLLVADLYPDMEAKSFADHLIDHLTEQLRYQLSRPLESEEAHTSKKARKAGKAGKGIGSAQKELLSGLCAMLGGDEELRGRWPHLSDKLSAA